MIVAGRADDGAGPNNRRLPGRAHVDTKGGDISDVVIFWLGDSHCKRMYLSVPEDTPVAVGYAWLAIQPGWESVLDDVVGQLANCGASPRIFLSLGGRMITVSGMDHSQVKTYLLEVAKKWINQGFSMTIMELPFGADQDEHVETWRTTCLIRGINTLLLESSPAAGLMLQSVTTRGDRSAALGLGDEFPMRRDLNKFADQVHLRDENYLEVAEETLKEFSANGFSDVKIAWMMEAGQVTTMVTPPGLETSWAEFLQGRRTADEVQLWNEDELFRAPQRVRTQSLPGWQPWQQHQSGYGRARGGRQGRGRGHRGGRGTTPGGWRPSWHGTRADRRPREAKSYFFN